MGCCPSKPRDVAHDASGAERADKAEAVESAEGIPDVAEASGAASNTAGGANATSAVTLAPDTNRRARVKQEETPGREVLGEEEEEKDGDEEGDDEDPQAHLIPVKTSERSDSGDRGQFQLEASKFPSSGRESVTSPAAIALRSPARTPVNYDDMPIASTYHRVLSATIADKEAKRKEEERLEAEQHEREVQEYKAAMML